MYGNVADWIAYADARGATVADDTASLAALVRASDYIAFNYVNRFAVGNDADSDNVKEATYEAAALELTTPGFFSTTFTPDQQKVLTSVGDIKWSMRGNASGVDGATPISTKIEAMLRPYLTIYTGVFTV